MDTRLPDMPIVDAHLHVYDPEAIPYPWMADLPLLNEAHGPNRMLREAEGIEIEAAVFVEVDAAPGHHMDEVRHVAGTMGEVPVLRAMVASMPLEDGPAAVADDLAAFAAMPGARGVRRLIQGHADEPGWALRPPFVEAVRSLADYGLSFDICIVHGQMRDATALVRACPDVRFILDHIGKPDIRAGRLDPWRDDLSDLAALPNVTCKISGVVTEADHRAWTVEDIAPFVRHAIDRFGFDRVMFGGDWPVSRLATTYPRWVSTMAHLLSGATASERAAFWRGTAREVYRLAP
ncbi:MAG: amidohydrolase family protein [Pseudomonadota bacterium]